MIYKDIKKQDRPLKSKKNADSSSHLKLITDKKNLYFDVEDEYPLDKDVIIIGRSANCNISIDDLYMSQEHTQLWHEDNEWFISDMGSTNGTYINGIKMEDEPLILDNGDKIKIGHAEFLVVLV